MGIFLAYYLDGMLVNPERSAPVESASSLDKNAYAFNIPSD